MYNEAMKIKELQDILYDIYTITEETARKVNVPVWPYSGTEIGAVREKNFIPWDDDMDIQMRYSDYLKLKPRLLKELPDYLKLVEPEDFSPYFYDFLPRIVDTRYLLREETEEDRAYHNLQNHPSLDIFLIMQAPDSAFSRRLLYYRTLFVYVQAMNHRFSEKHEAGSILVKAAMKGISFLGKKHSVGDLYRKYLKINAKWEGQRTKTMAIMNDVLTSFQITARTIDHTTAFLPAAWFAYSKPEGELRGRKTALPAGYHEQLTRMYGDYMTPPEDLKAYNLHLNEEDMGEAFDAWERERNEAAGKENS